MLAERANQRRNKKVKAKFFFFKSDSSSLIGLFFSSEVSNQTERPLNDCFVSHGNRQCSILASDRFSNRGERRRSSAGHVEVKADEDRSGIFQCRRRWNFQVEILETPRSGLSKSGSVFDFIYGKNLWISWPAFLALFLLFFLLFSIKILIQFDALGELNFGGGLSESANSSRSFLRINFVCKPFLKASLSADLRSTTVERLLCKHAALPGRKVSASVQSDLPLCAAKDFQPSVGRSVTKLSLAACDPDL